MTSLKELKRELRKSQQKLSALRFLRVLSYVLIPVFFILFFVLAACVIALLQSGHFFAFVAVVCIIGHIVWYDQKNRGALYRFVVEHLKYDINITLDDISSLEYIISMVRSGQPIDKTRLMVTAHVHSPSEELSWLD